MTTTTEAPPGKLSDLIELAVTDARKLDRKRYLPWFNDWHANRGPAWETVAGGPEDGWCRVCLCGGVLAGRLGASHNRTFVLHDYGDTIEISDGKRKLGENGWGPALAAVDAAREGNWLQAANILEIEMSRDTVDSVLEIEPACHREFEGWEAFDLHCDSMLERAGQLRALGI